MLLSQDLNTEQHAVSLSLSLSVDMDVKQTIRHSPHLFDVHILFINNAQSRQHSIGPPASSTCIRSFVCTVSVFYTSEYCLPLVAMVTWHLFAFLSTLLNLHCNWICILYTTQKHHITRKSTLCSTASTPVLGIGTLLSVTWSYQEWVGRLVTGFLCCRTPCLESTADRLETLVFNCFIQEKTQEFSVSCCLHWEHCVNSGMRHRSDCRGRTTSHCCCCYCYYVCIFCCSCLVTVMLWWAKVDFKKVNF